MATVAGDSSQVPAVTNGLCEKEEHWGSPQMKGKLQFLLLAISTLDQTVGLLDGWLIHENGVLGVTGLQGVVLLVLVSCDGKETR